MDISSVKTPPAQQTQRPKRTEETQQAQSREAKPQATEAKKPPEHQPVPVINTQGHVTGRLLNVTA